MSKSDTALVDLLRLGIGPLTMGAFCPDEQARSRLVARYENFLVDTTPAWHIEIIYSHQEHDESITNGINFIDDRLWVNEAGGWGWVSASQKQGALNLGLHASEGTVDNFLRAAFALLAYEAGGFMLHAAGIIRDNLAICFFGRSGSGKTTVSRLSPPGSVLNDDLLILLPNNEAWVVYGTPFTNPTQVQPSNRSVQLGGLYRLIQDTSVYLEPIYSSQALAELFSCLPIIPTDPMRSMVLLTRLQNVLAKYPVYGMHFKQDSSFWAIFNG